MLKNWAVGAFVAVMAGGLAYAAAPKAVGGSGGGSARSVRVRSGSGTANIDRMFQVDVHVRAGGMEASARYLVMNATQSNYVFKNEEGRAFIVNLLPVVVPDKTGIINTQAQIELSRVGAKKSSTFQMQTEVLLRIGKKTVIADSPDAKVSLTFSDWEPPE